MKDLKFRFHPKLLDCFNNYGKNELCADIGAGISVGILALPLAMAFAIASGVSPAQGLYTAVIAGLQATAELDYHAIRPAFQK